MKNIFMGLFLTWVLLFHPAFAEAGNGGNFESKRQVGTERYAPGEPFYDPKMSPGQYVDHHAWRSGLAGTLAMWRKLFTNALPSNEPLKTTPKKTGPPAKK